MYSKTKFLTFTARNMLRKIALELDAAQRLLVEDAPAASVVRGHLERAASYLKFAETHDRIQDISLQQRIAVETIVSRLEGKETVVLPREVFSLVNAVYHSVAERAGMPVGEQHFCVRIQDDLQREPSRFPCIAVADNIRSAFNVGTLFRTADGFGVESLVLTGISPGPENAKVRKTAMGSDAFQPWERKPTMMDAIQSLGAVHIYALETVQGSVSLFDVSFQYPMAVLLGNEEFGILEDALDVADTIVHIPMYGKKNSFNVGVSFGMVMSEARRQWEQRAKEQR